MSMKQKILIEGVGSFLPPQYIVDAREAQSRGQMTAEEVRREENKVVDDIVERQLAAGLREVTSGEIRRHRWDKDFWLGFKGIELEHVDTGYIYEPVEPYTDVIRVVDRIEANPQHPFLSGFRYLLDKVNGRAVCRQTIPSPANLYAEIVGISQGNIASVYPYSDDLVADIAKAYNDTLKSYYDGGCRSVQFDDTVIGRLCDMSYEKELLRGGIDMNKYQADIIRVLNQSVAGLPADMQVSLFISGGDVAVPRWSASEEPDNIVPKVLRDVNINKFYMPFDPSNLESIAVLKHLPADKRVVVGLVNAHTPWADGFMDFNTALDEVLKYVPAERLAVSPQTGFKLSGTLRRGLTYEDQWRKLKMLSDALEGKTVVSR